MKFRSKKPAFEHLRKKWIARQRTAENNFWDQHGDFLKRLALGSLGGLMLFSQPVSIGNLSDPARLVSKDDAIKNYDQAVLLAAKLREYVPNGVRPLNLQEEDKILKILSDNLGVKVTAEVDDIRLNRNFGIIGGEQHLYRYPGDNLYAHFDSTTDWAMFANAGIAPNLGAWGYFTSSKQDFSRVDKLREKYYLAIQTFLVPGYAENVTVYRDFFKFRKMLVVNPQTGQAVVAVIGDAGPSVWTGKDLGGSPEVMHELGLANGPRKGEILYFFLDDPRDEVPLGPIKAK